MLDWCSALMLVWNAHSNQKANTNVKTWCLERTVYKVNLFCRPRRDHCNGIIVLGNINANITIEIWTTLKSCERHSNFRYKCFPMILVGHLWNHGVTSYIFLMQQISQSENWILSLMLLSSRSISLVKYLWFKVTWEINYLWLNRYFPIGPSILSWKDVLLGYFRRTDGDNILVFKSLVI